MEHGSTFPPALVVSDRLHTWLRSAWNTLLTQRATLVLSGICLSGLALRLWHLSAKSLWIDETFSIGMATQSWPSFLRTIGTVQPNMELYYILLKLLASVTPFAWQRGELFWRLIPALAGSAVIPVVFALARRLFTTRVALLAAALVAVNAFMVEYSQQARGYTLFVLLLTLAYLQLVRWLEGQRRALLWFALLTALGFLTQAFEVVFLTAQVAFILFVALRRRWLPWRPLVLALIPVSVVIALRYPLYAAHPDQVSWIQRPTITDLWHGMQDLIGASGVSPRFGNGLLLVVLAAVVVAVVWAVMSGKRANPLDWFNTLNQTGERSAVPSSPPLHAQHGGWRHPLPSIEAVALLVTWFAIPLLGTWVGSQIKPVWVTRYLSPVSIAACLIVAVAIAAVTSWVRQVGVRPWLFAVLSMAALAAWIMPMRAYQQRAAWEDWRGAAHAVNVRFQAGDGIVCYDNQWGCDFGFSHYLQSAGGPARFDPAAPGAFSWDTYARPDREAIFARAVDPQYLAPYLARHGRVWVLLGHYVNGLGDWQHGLAWLTAHAHLVSKTVFAGDIEVYLYESGGNQSYVRSTP